MAVEDKNIIVINSGSSSIKYKLIGQPSGRVMASGSIERIGESVPTAELRSDRGVVRRELAPMNHASAFRTVAELLTDPDRGVFDDFSRVDAFGHRVVHGGERYSEAVVVDEEVMRGIEECASLAPLHNPANLLGIRAARELAPGTPQVAVFDTAFHQSIPREAYRYAIPESLYREKGIRRYGFHGTSYQYVSRRVAEMAGLPRTAGRWIICHLGNGCSVAAVREGKCVDTSMGMTPLEGLVMGSRSGDVDPAVLIRLVREGSDADELDRLVNRESGLLGLSGTSNDMRELQDRAEEGDDRARLAIGVFCHRVRKYIGAYLAILGDCDGIVFTGGIGEHGVETRQRILVDMNGIGIDLDENRNAETRGKEGEISTEGSKIRIFVIPTDEEGEIARETFRLTGNS